MADRGDRVFCHACSQVWLRNDYGLICPHCESEFTEIVRNVPTPLLDAVVVLTSMILLYADRSPSRRPRRTGLLTPPTTLDAITPGEVSITRQAP